MLLVFIYMVLILSYGNYAQYFIYCLIAMISQIIFSYFIVKKQIWKTIVTVFLTQGIIMAVSQLIYDGLANFHYRQDVILYITSIILLLFILVLIEYLVYKNIKNTISSTKWIALMSGFLINISIMLIIIFKVNIPFELLP